MSDGYRLVRVLRGEEASVHSVPVPPEVGPTVALARGKEGEIVTLNYGAVGSSLRRQDRAGSLGAHHAGGRGSAPRHFIGKLVTDPCRGTPPLFTLDGSEALLLDGRDDCNVESHCPLSLGSTAAAAAEPA